MSALLVAGVLSVTACGGPDDLHERQPTAPTTRPASLIAAEESVSVDLEALGLEPEQLGLEPEQISVSATREKLRVTMPSGILFNTGEATLQSASVPILQQIARLAQRDSGRLQIEGHTDDVGGDAYNLDLSQRRAATVSQWLSGHGVAAARIDEVGYGELWPHVPNTSPENRALNRRVEVVFDGIGGDGISIVQISGHWSGNWGHMLLRTEGERVYGTYANDQGTLLGEWRDGELVAWWSESPSREPDADAGECAFRFEQQGDEIVLDGRWRYGVSGEWKDNWDLKHVESPAPAELQERMSDLSAFRPHP